MWICCWLPVWSSKHLFLSPDSISQYIVIQQTHSISLLCILLCYTAVFLQFVFSWLCNQASPVMDTECFLAAMAMHTPLSCLLNHHPTSLVFFYSSFIWNKVFQASSKASLLRAPLTLSSLTLPIYASLATKKYYTSLTLKCFNLPMGACAASCDRKSSPNLSIWLNFIILDGRIPTISRLWRLCQNHLVFSLVHAQSRDSDHKQPLSAIVMFYKFSEMEEEKLVRKCQDLSQLFDLGSNTFR